MKYGTQPGQNIQRIIAYDADSGRNAEIKYRIEQAGNYAKYFSVDENTGMVSLKREISHSIRRPIMFNLIAEDLGAPAKSSSVSVSVNFADRDNEPPKWLPETEKRFERTVRIPEAISLNQVVETLDALSNYAPNSKLIFDFSPKPSPESFIIQQERLPGTNQYRGKIIVYQPLDAETQSFYEWSKSRFLIPMIIYHCSHSQRIWRLWQRTRQLAPMSQRFVFFKSFIK